jgi:VIT1/CCC1 family predicted Fe2+/Mn2+ transporter
MRGGIGTTTEGGRARDDGMVLSPVERLSEWLYGTILVLTFTGTVRVAIQEEDSVRAILGAAVGCSLAWGIVDAIMFVVGRVVPRKRVAGLLAELRDSDSPAVIRRLAEETMPRGLTQVIRDDEWGSLRERFLRVPHESVRTGVTAQDLKGALAIFLLANAALLPLALPFAFVQDVHLANRVSNGIAIAMLFATGWALAPYTGQRPLRLALITALGGSLLVALTIALGG